MLDELLGARKNLGAGVGSERPVGKLLRLGKLQPTNQVFHLRDIRGSDAEFIDAEPQEQGNHVDVAGHLAANTGPDAGPGARQCGLPDEIENGRMRGLVEVRYFLVQPIDREGVLNEIIRADAEKTRALAALFQTVKDETMSALNDFLDEERALIVSIPVRAGY